MTDFNLKKWLSQSLKFHGFSLKADATSYLIEQFSNLPPGSRKKVLIKLTDHLRSLNSSSLIIDKHNVEICFQESLLDKPSAETIWNVLDAFNIPRFIFNRELNKFVKDDSVKKEGLFADGPTKLFVKKRLYDAVWYKTMKQDAINQVFMVNGKKFQYIVKTVEWFLCATEKVEHAVIIGLLVQKPDGGYAVEDPTGTLDLDITQTKFSDGFFAEHSFVFIEGVYEDKIFYVLRLGLPPAEASDVSRLCFDSNNYFGGLSNYTLKNSKALKKHEEMNPDEMVVFISDIWLDEPQVFKKLNALFKGFSSFPPLAFVFLGNFLSCQKVATYGEELKQGFAKLGNLIANYESICKKSHFVLVPGPFDIGSPRILPRPPLSKHLVKDLEAKVPKLMLATNPCRIQYCTKEIVVVREDLVTKLCRNTIHFPDTSSNKISFHFAKTIVSQGTLTPMSLMVCPVYWNFSHALDLYPLPDLVIAADSFNAFSEKYMNCVVTSPGSFVKEKFSFKVYFPFKNEIEDSCIPDDM